MYDSHTDLCRQRNKENGRIAPICVKDRYIRDAVLLNAIYCKNLAVGHVDI
jgi:hypothetical protein